METSKGVCIVPIGCLEKHGPHSPLGTDTIIAGETARRAAEIEPAVVFPTMFFGDKSGASQFQGTVIFSLETRWHIFRETCNAIHRNGFKKILFINGHGGNNDMLGAFTRAMMEENPNIMLFKTSSSSSTAIVLTEILANREKFNYLTDEDCAALQDFLDQKKVTGHACFSETARVYHFRPERSVWMESLMRVATVHTGLMRSQSIRSIPILRGWVTIPILTMDPMTMF